LIDILFDIRRCSAIEKSGREDRLILRQAQDKFRMSDFSISDVGFGMSDLGGCDLEAFRVDERAGEPSSVTRGRICDVGVTAIKKVRAVPACRQAGEIRIPKSLPAG
jgi:hypothetical protein